MAAQTNTAIQNIVWNIALGVALYVCDLYSVNVVYFPPFFRWNINSITLDDTSTVKTIDLNLFLSIHVHIKLHN